MATQDEKAHGVINVEKNDSSSHNEIIGLDENSDTSDHRHDWTADEERKLV